MESPITFDQWLRQRRVALKLTREQLARRVGCSVSALRKIEDGERRPSLQIAELLANSLDIAPDERPTFLKVARGELSVDRLSPAAGREAVSPPVARPELRSNLPVHATPLVGRGRELAELDRLLRDPQCRLITLVGPGGMGKTRLAVEAASRSREAFGDGACFVALAPLNSPDFIIPAIADAVGFAFSGPVDPQTQLLNHLRDKRALVVLDNIEHLLPSSMSPAVDGAARGSVEALAEILRRAPGVTLLVTSREVLNVQDEWVFEVQGLRAPDASPPGRESGEAERLEDYSAVELFLQRVRRSNVGFAPTTDDYPAIARICQMVEGMPLGIELAAAWMRTLSCAEIVREMESGLDFLTASARDLPARHRSVRAVFEHSWRLLAEDEQRVLSRLTVFQGGFRREAAEQVAGATLSLLSALIAKSLLRRAEAGRYDLHEVIRQYARVHLEEDESRCLETRDRHSEYYLGLASEYERKLKSASQQTAMRDMTIELDNLRTAWDWGTKRGKFESIGRAVRSFGWYFEVAGLIHDGIDQLGLLVRALSGKPRDCQMDRVLGSALVQQGLLCFRSGQFAQAQERYEDAITILRSINEQALLADALIFSGTLEHLNGDYLESKKLIQEGLVYAQATHDSWFAAYGIYNLGHVDSLMGEYQKGHEQMQAGLELWRALGDPHSISLGLNFLVDTQIKLGRHEEAIIAMRESIALCERTKNRWGMATAYRYLGLATMAAGRYAEAQGHFRKSLEVFGEYFKGWDIARTLSYLGDAALRAGNLVEAGSVYRDALQVAVEAKAIPIALDVLVGIAQVHARHEGCELALEFCHHVLNHPASTGEAREHAQWVREKLESQIAAPQAETIRKRAEARTFEALVDEALKPTVID